MIFLSIIIPVYNEAKRVHNIEKIFDYLKSKKYKSEVVVVNDGSVDQTLKLLNQIKKNSKIKIISYQKNQGKGFAIKQGMLSSKGKYRLFLDVDLSTPIEEFEKFISKLSKSDIVIATRKKTGARVKVHQPFLRENMGKGFTFLSQKTLGLKISDFTCGFKCFSDKAAQDIFSKAQINRWGFDSEILFLANKYKYSVTEVPVNWINDSNTKVRFPQDIIRSFNELAAVVINNIKGKYDKKI